MLENVITMFHWFMIKKWNSIQVGLESKWICFPYIEIYYDTTKERIKLKSLRHWFIDVWWFEYDFISHIKQVVWKVNLELYESKNKKWIKQPITKKEILNLLVEWKKRNN